jgi:hypothetical protein
MNQAEQTRVANWAVGSALLIAFSVGSYLLFSGRNEQSARVMTKMEITSDQPVAPGQIFRLRVRETLNALCPYQIHWFLVRPDHIEALSVIEPVRPAQPQLGLVTAENEHTVPADFKPGNYTYTSQVFDLCPGHSYVSQISTPIRIGEAVK